MESVFKGQGFPSKKQPAPHLVELAHRALEIFEETAEPKGVLSDISLEEFSTVYYGEGHNDESTPLGDIYPSADSLALYVVTLGKEISCRIDDLFRANDFALGALLDTAASEGCERAAVLVEERWRTSLQERGRLPDSFGVLPFSPGYCGWHVSAQRKLFEMLNPEEIGVTLTESCLMEPLKSVSGVLVAGRREIFDFDEIYPFCADCETHTCRERIAALYEKRSD